MIKSKAHNFWIKLLLWQRGLLYLSFSVAVAVGIQFLFSNTPKDFVGAIVTGVLIGLFYVVIDHFFVVPKMRKEQAHGD